MSSAGSTSISAVDDRVASPAPKSHPPVRHQGLDRRATRTRHRRCLRSPPPVARGPDGRCPGANTGMSACPADDDVVGERSLVMATEWLLIDLPAAGRHDRTSIPARLERPPSPAAGSCRTAGRRALSLVCSCHSTWCCASADVLRDGSFDLGGLDRSRRGNRGAPGPGPARARGAGHGERLLACGPAAAP